MKEIFDDFGAPLVDGKLGFVYVTRNLKTHSTDERPTVKLKDLTREDFERIYMKIKNERYDDFGTPMD